MLSCEGEGAALWPHPVRLSSRPILGCHRTPGGSPHGSSASRPKIKAPPPLLRVRQCLSTCADDEALTSIFDSAMIAHWHATHLRRPSTPGRLHEAQHARISKKSRRSLPVQRRPLTQRACTMLPRGGLEAKPQPRVGKRASRPISVAHTVKGRTTEPVLGRYELFHPGFLCSGRLHLNEER